MKAKLYFSLLLLSISVKTVMAQQPTGMSPAMKLQYYAGACNAAQIELLLAKDQTFDIYSSGVTNSPVMVAIDRFITANNATNLKSCSECLATIKAIIRDSRYKYKEMPDRDKTDLMYVIMSQKKVTNVPLQLSGYNNLFFMMLDELDKKPGFDINYTIATNMNNLPSNVLGALAYGGHKNLFCALTSRYPDLKNNLDKRSRSSAYTPLMLAAMHNNMEIVNALASNGADYYLAVDGFGIFPPDEVALQNARTAISVYLNNRRLGLEPASTLLDYCK